MALRGRGSSPQEEGYGQQETYAAILEENRLLREQMKDYIAIQRRNGKLQESRDYWQGQTRRTRRVTTDKKAVTPPARNSLSRTTGPTSR